MSDCCGFRLHTTPDTVVTSIPKPPTDYYHYSGHHISNKSTETMFPTITTTTATTSTTSTSTTTTTTTTTSTTSTTTPIPTTEETTGERVSTEIFYKNFQVKVKSEFFKNVILIL